MKMSSLRTFTYFQSGSEAIVLASPQKNSPSGKIPEHIDSPRVEPLLLRASDQNSQSSRRIERIFQQTAEQPHWRELCARLVPCPSEHRCLQYASRAESVSPLQSRDVECATMADSRLHSGNHSEADAP